MQCPLKQSLYWNETNALTIAKTEQIIASALFLLYLIPTNFLLIMIRILYLTILLFCCLNSVNAQSSLLSKDSKKVFTVVEDMPIPWFYKTACLDVDRDDKQNCYYQKLKEYLGQKLSYPDAAISNKTEGTVIIQFVINKDGSITDAVIIKDIGDGCGVAALRVINNMPNWIPGKQRNIPVNVQYTLPVKFQLKK